MKKVKIIILFMTLFLGIFFLMPAKVFAADLTPAEWYNHISQFTIGIAKGEISYGGSIKIVEEPGHVYVDQWIIYYGDADWFEPELSWIEQWVDDDEDILTELEEEYEDYDGYLYWNFEEGYWQIESYGVSELDYYKQRVDELEDEISSLEDEISLLEDEIQDLEDEISLLEENNNDITKWFVPLVVIIIVVGIIEPIILIKRRG